MGQERPTQFRAQQLRTRLAVLALRVTLPLPVQTAQRIQVMAGRAAAVTERLQEEVMEVAAS